jgi:hypothetical protein
LEGCAQNQYQQLEPHFVRVGLQVLVMSEFEPLTDDPGDWPSTISDRQVCDIVARGPPQQNKSYEFPFNEKRRCSQVRIFIESWQTARKYVHG